MAALKIRRRSRLRRKEASDWTERLASEFGMAVPSDEIPIDEAEAGAQRLLLRENEAFPIPLGNAISPSNQGLHAFHAMKRPVIIANVAVRISKDVASLMTP